MGVDGLYKFIYKNCPDIFNTVSINEIRGKSCIIDGMQHIYGQLIYMRSRDKEIISTHGKNISHIHGLINSLTYYLKNGIIPIFVFDGKTPEIKKKKIEERKKNLKENLIKLKNLQIQKDNLNGFINSLYNGQDFINDIEKEDDIIFGTPPVDTINIDEELIKMQSIQEEYKKIYKKSIVMKDYFIKDWIKILELLGLLVIKASGEADPLCAYMLKKNSHIYGIISDDSDMLVFGSPILMRKSVNQQFTIIELKSLLNKIEYLVSVEFGSYIEFKIGNLVDFSILLGTDYGTFVLNYPIHDSFEILKYYIRNNKDYTKIISPEQYENFEIIKKYYTEENFGNEFDKFLEKPKWDKPNFLELKKMLLDLDVDEDYIDKNNSFLDLCYNKIKKGKFKNNYDNIYYNEDNHNREKRRYRSNSFDSKKNLLSYENNRMGDNYMINHKGNYTDTTFKINKNPTVFSEKYSSSCKDNDIILLNKIFFDNNYDFNNDTQSLFLNKKNIDDDKLCLENNNERLSLDNNNDRFSLGNNNERFSLDSIENEYERDSISKTKMYEGEIFDLEN